MFLIPPAHAFPPKKILLIAPFCPRAEDYKTREGRRRGGEAEKVPISANAPQQEA